MKEVIREREVKILEFDQIRSALVEMTVSPMAAEKAGNLYPSSDKKVVAKWQQETAEGRLICLNNAFSPSTVADIASTVNRAEKGAVLPGKDLLSVLSFLKAVNSWILFFKDEDHRSTYPTMADYALMLDLCRKLVEDLDKALNHEGQVVDEASNTLFTIRRKIFNIQQKIRDRLEDYIRNSSTRKYLQDPIVTIRGNRYVLPVKQEYRQFMNGVVHDQSASGATLFIEPMPVVQMQNELSGLKGQEEQEIERILYKLSGIVADHSSSLLHNRSIYTELDLIMARGRFSLSIGGKEPLLTDKMPTGIYLKDARHPLLPGDKVPLDLDLSGQIRALVVTGPNTGGKTVALKTVGLLAIMAQCGLHIPVDKEAKTSVFKCIRADIGDEQSIAQSLSTFSAHMKNIIEIVSDAGSKDLVLLDELGAGTDPSEGAALAMALLEELADRGTLTIATTHMNELKLFAQMRDNMQNGAMEFDPDSLTPTYRLLQGIPGQSNAFHIAEGLGLPDTVLSKAKGFVHRTHEQVESVIASLVEEQQRYHRNSHLAALDKNRAKKLLEELEEEKELFKARREDLLNEAKKEAKDILRKTKNSSDRIMKELRSIQKSESAVSLGDIEKLRNELRVLRDEIDGEMEDEIGPVLDLRDIKKGMHVYISTLKQNGEVLSVTDEDIQVQVGAMKITVPPEVIQASKIKSNKKEKALKGKEWGGYSVSKDLNISSSLDLRGCNLEQSIPLIEKLLDNALWAGLGRVDLIHGKGTGKLKEGIRRYLGEHRLVKSLRRGGQGEGGDGVTVVELKH